MYFLNAYNNKFKTYKDFLLFELFNSATFHLFQFCLKRAEARRLKGDRDTVSPPGGKSYKYWHFTLVISIIRAPFQI